MGAALKREFDRHGKCPICHREFRSDGCPHSLGQAEKAVADRAADEKVRRIVRQELAARGRA